mmetsp:Transcript_86621/g.279688  ORF Transcript_86621/g.279688 Transcript_86621/m.279688 type:complete len:464 (+) Transcript_86621:776-2167(+)
MVAVVGGVVDCMIHQLLTLGPPRPEEPQLPAPVSPRPASPHGCTRRPRQGCQCCFGPGRLLPRAEVGMSIPTAVLRTLWRGRQADLEAGAVRPQHKLTHGPRGWPRRRPRPEPPEHVQVEEAPRRPQRGLGAAEVGPRDGERVARERRRRQADVGAVLREPTAGQELEVPCGEQLLIQHRDVAAKARALQVAQARGRQVARDKQRGVLGEPRKHLGVVVFHEVAARLAIGHFHIRQYHVGAQSCQNSRRQPSLRNLGASLWDQAIECAPSNGQKNVQASRREQNDEQQRLQPKPFNDAVPVDSTLDGQVGQATEYQHVQHECRPNDRSKTGDPRASHPRRVADPGTRRGACQCREPRADVSSALPARRVHLVDHLGEREAVRRNPSAGLVVPAGERFGQAPEGLGQTGEEGEQGSEEIAPGVIGTVQSILDKGAVRAHMAHWRELKGAVFLPQEMPQQCCGRV